MTDVYTIDELRKMIIPLLARYDMAQAHVFGSYARNEANGLSDIDVLLVGNEGFRPFNVLGVAQDLNRISGKKVDVYELSELDEGSFKEAVLKEAILL
ncbi:MAG: nucleotidyltransferase domain-containing protein [Eggerthellaceae bacterium]|nr:nucleotidyltransferase domain-containing protein [Eggerthellaceae bacterium]